MPVLKIPPILVGVSGEYFVAAELSRRGWIASISLRNTRGIDILVTNQEATRSITIQCKTSLIKRKKWVLNDRCETFYSADHFYVFVALGEPTERPDYHIIASQDLANTVSTAHKLWLQTPGRRGRQHMQTTVRNFEDYGDKYLERWDLLGL